MLDPFHIGLDALAERERSEREGGKMIVLHLHMKGIGTAIIHSRRRREKPEWHAKKQEKNSIRFVSLFPPSDDQWKRSFPFFPLFL